MTNTLLVKIIEAQPHFLNAKNSAQQFAKAEVLVTKEIINITLFNREVYILLALGTNNPLKVELKMRRVPSKNTSRPAIVYYNVVNIFAN